MFADNGRWWLISVSAQPFTNVSVDAVDRDGTRAPIAGLCADTLPSLEQRSQLPPGNLDREDHTTLEVCWHERNGLRHTYAVCVRNDGMRSERAGAA